MKEKQGLPFTSGHVVDLPLGRVGVAAFHLAPPYGLEECQACNCPDARTKGTLLTYLLSFSNFLKNSFFPIMILPFWLSPI